MEIKEKLYKEKVSKNKNYWNTLQNARNLTYLLLSELPQRGGMAMAFIEGN
jgi:hypothetical protein